VITVERLAVRYGAALAVDDVSFVVQPGETFGLVGRSGCGKSTILRCLIGLEPRWRGRIVIDGAPASSGRRPPSFYRHVQIVFQDPYGSLHPRQTVDTALREVVAIHRLDPARIAAALDEVGLPAGLRYRYPHELSGGQRQRVAIARALLPGPRVLLLDEPTSALDVSVQAEILNLLTDIRAREQLTCVLVSHDFGVIGHMCDRVAVMDSGQIVEQCDVGDLADPARRSPWTRRLLDASAGYSRALAEEMAEAWT